MVGAWRQLASYDNGDKVANALPIQGPNTWAEAKKNIYKHVQESWDKAVDTDQTFHPLVSAFMDAIIVTAAWATLAHFGYTSHALFYLFLDGYNNVKSSLILGKDKDTFRRDFVVACIGGIVRGFFKNMQKSSIFLNNASYSIMRSYYLAMITFTCVIFGHILRLALIQALPVEKSKEMMTKAYLMDIFKSIQARCNSIHAQAVAYKEHYLGGQKTKTA